MGWAEHYRGEWEEACAELDRIDPGWRWEAILARQPVLPTVNDAVAVTQTGVAKLPPGWPDWTPAVDRTSLPKIPFRKWPDTPETLALRRTMLLESQIRETPANQRLNSRIADMLEVLVASSAEALEATSNLADLQTGRAPKIDRPVMLNLPNGIPTRVVTTVLQYHAFQHIERGELEEAVCVIRRMFAAARVALASPMLMTALVNFAIRHLLAITVERCLAHGELRQSTLVSLQKDVEKALAEPILRIAIRGERSLLEDLARGVEEGLTTVQAINKAGRFFPPFRTGWRLLDYWIDRLLHGGYNLRGQARILTYYSDVLNLLSESPEALTAKRRDWLALRTKYGPAVRSHHLALEAVVEADRKQRSRLRSLSTALAAEVFRMEMKRWPVGLHELVPINLSQLPADPYDFSPLKPEIHSDGITIAARGLQPGDEAAQVKPLYSSMQQGPIGIRLYHPQCRGLPS